MSRIRSKNTSIDLRMKEILTELNFSYKMYPKMFGNPDFLLEDRRIIIFCDGDFWHGYKYFEKKKLAKKYWRNKIETNIRRDMKISRKLRVEKWSVLRFWEHDIKKNPDKCKNKIIRKIKEKKA